MKTSRKSLLSIFVAATTVISANAGSYSNNINGLGRYAYKSRHTSAFQGTRQQRIEALSSMMNQVKTPLKENAFKPNQTLGPADIAGTMDGPGNEMWFYTAHFTYQNIVHQYFTEKIMTEYEFRVYDASMKEVGSVHDKVRYASDEVRIPIGGCDIVPAITKNFFNDDDKYELMVSMDVNSTTPGYNHSRTMVYSLGGEKEILEVLDPAYPDQSIQSPTHTLTKEFDKPITTVGFVVDVLDASKDGNENIFISFAQESFPSSEFDGDLSSDEGKNFFWNYVSGAKQKFEMYSKATDDSGIKKIFEKEIPLLSLPGNQESSPYMISFNRDGEAYFIFQQYKKLFYKPYYTYDAEYEMEEDNFLKIDLYKVNEGKTELIQTTEIPVVKDTSVDALATYYATGDMRYIEDISFGQYTQDGKASYVITRKNYLSGDQTDQSFYVYSSDGKLLKTLFEYADGTLSLSNISGYEPQQMFVSIEEGKYIFNMVNLTSGETATKINSVLKIDEDSDADQMTANLDRTPVGDSYNYVIELGVPSVDENDNNILRIGWFDKDGKYKEMHEVNMGKDVRYAQCYLQGAALRSDIFVDDDLHEYMLLIKRSTGTTTTQEELLIAQQISADTPSGKNILILTPEERKGSIINIMPYLGVSSPILSVLYQQSDTDALTNDIYYLPFGSSAVTEIASDFTDSDFYYDGNAIHADGCLITVFDLEGKKAASGLNTVSVSGLPSGIYVATANGNARKFIVK